MEKSLVPPQERRANQMALRVKVVSAAYYRFLNSIDWTDDIVVAGLREGLNKFLSNAFIYLVKKESGLNKYQQADWVSVEAKAFLEKNQKTSLVYEHMVPKQRYIQKPCEMAAKTGHLSLGFVEKILMRYWRIAVVTKDEDMRLSRSKMPDNWDGVDIFARYKMAGISLVEFSTEDVT